MKNEVSSEKYEVRSWKSENKNIFSGSKFLFLTSCFLLHILSSCHVYSFKDVSIPPEVKTVKIGFIENKARYVNPQLSPRLTDRLQQKIANQTRLTRTNNDDAHYQISGYISQDKEKELIIKSIEKAQGKTQRCRK